MALILALDTTAEACSVALLHHDQLLERIEREPRQHTRRAMPLTRELLAEAGITVKQLDAIAFGCGPGSFTGLRIAAGLAQGLALGAGLPVIQVSSLAAVAHQVFRQHADASRVAVAFDARMDEVYWGCYQREGDAVVLMDEERVCPPEAVSLPEGEGLWTGAGDGWRYRARMPQAVTDRVDPVLEEAVPLAADVARLGLLGWQAGEGVAAEQAQPVYLRDQVAWKKLPGRD
ncbi:tRNA (adenosine(37)-N6)-threonylcarbamoyltransferase complex dimerization subunit type 1 TsaB [Marinobacteraceae bacterium S3BR75-40.1]